MQIKPVNSTNYKGIPIADVKVKGINSQYKLFSVNFRDKDFLENMYQSIKLEKLMPGLFEYDYIIWDEILHNAIKLLKGAYAKSILGVCDNKPCGILNYKDVGNKYHLNYVATFPIESGKRVPCAGQILFNEFLKRFIKSDKKSIELCATKSSPFSPISTYLKLGFSMNGGDNYNEFMSTNRNKAMQTLLKQKEFINYKPVKNPEYVDLNKDLKLNFIT